MNWPTSRYQLIAYFLAASSCLVVLSPARSNDQSSHGNQHRVVSDDSTNPQQARTQRDNPLSSWGPRVLRVGRDLGFVVASIRFTASLGAVSASALAVYYDNQRPYPATCHPPAQDKWQHCYVGCEIATWCPVGSFSASILAIMKEIRDAENHGEFSWPDVFATLGGAWDCASSESCEACCCKRLGLANPNILQDRLLTAGCATCIFEMKDVTGCKLAVEIDGKHYLVKGSDIDDHGDAHADDGLCNSSMKAVVSGEIKDVAVVSTSFRVLPK
jgi:hypothetical protein